MQETLQQIRMGSDTIMDNTIDMFFRSRTDVFKIADDAFNLRPDNFFDFFTYFNTFSLKKWKKYADIGELFLELDISGSFYVDLFGHYIDSNGLIQKEMLGKYFFDSRRRQTYTLKFPEDCLSEVVSFLIYVVKDDAKLYGGRYLTELEEPPKQPVLSVVTVGNDNDELLTRTENIINKLSSDPAFEDKLFFNVTKNTKADYVLQIDKNAYIEEDSVKRIYTFLSFLKKEYKNLIISAAMLNINQRNIQFKNHGFTDIDPENDHSDEADLNVWNLVVLNETYHGRKPIKLTDSRYVCIPAKAYGKKELPFFVSGKPAEDTSSDPAESVKYEIVTLNGLCFWFDENNLIQSKEDDYKEIENKEGNNANNQTSCSETLQDILLQDDSDTDEFIKLFYRSEDKVHMIDNKIFPLRSEVWYDFSTYFNSFSLNKWKKYTHIENVFLELEISGSVYIELMGHYADGNGNIHKEWLGRHEYDLENKQKVVMPVPADTNSDVISFVLYARKDSYIYSGRYFSEIPDGIKKHPHISLVTTTFKKENFVAKNIELLSNRLFEDKEFRDYFDWFIVDNGNTLVPEEIDNEKIHLIGNKNVGGAGGFARGIIEANNYTKKPTHIILMDDDVLFSVDAFKRVYKLLSLLKDEYADYFISGAMLEMEARHIQHEDIGQTSELGEHRPCKPKYDLSLWDSVIRNEEIIPPDEHQYAGWWFCCIPATIARNDNLPLPVFIRGDDIEYSHRNNAKFITMNGILIWHQGFTHKFSAALELYQVHRNDLILKALGRYVSDVNIIARMKTLFWEEIFKFNYKGAALIADALEDFLKGPEFIMNLKADKYMKAKRAKDNKLEDITSSLNAIIDYETLYEDKSLTERQQKIYDKTYNGHLLPFTGFKDRVGIIPYGWGYWPGKQYLASVIYAIDDYNHKFVKYEKSYTKFKAVTERFSGLMREYSSRKNELIDKYRSFNEEMTGCDFWSDYLRG